MRQVKYIILGAGSSGLTALSRIREETDDFVMINGGALGTTCARVGCMPSKALIHCADHYHSRKHFYDMGFAARMPCHWTMRKSLTACVVS